ncbi:polyketide synthase [Corynespora cassiicola Philippines]|uniref:Polyketide synthase n=1 Tax=Corynespora cassiicola Philippines TaxID=1448308 RepID=A0A2T2NWB1_CORCC|nr:polyketide synthase [Corynespora cassiicola Philippines]
MEKHAPIAICGMATRLPGGLKNPQQLYDFLLAKGDAKSRVPESRYNVSAYHSASGRPGSIITEYGYFLDESIKLGALDAARFSLNRSELEAADPQLRRMLEVVRECFDDAGNVGFKGENIGCYMGYYGEDWLEMQNRDPLQSGPYRVEGYSDFMLSNRVSYEMDLRGPSLTVRTACSSALVGLHEACLAIQRGDCDSAIVGGANLILGPNLTASMSEKGVLSPDGSCKTFSADANGYARGEAISAVYIKPLDAAMRDGNPIRAVIKGTMSNHDGKTLGVTLPSTESQEAMIRKAYQAAGINDFSKTAFVECHGTGTAIGDPIEVNAIARVFGDSGVFIGSVKPNLGHSEGASGLTSLIKCVLSLENRTILPNIKFTSPNPRIPFEENKLIVPMNPQSWPESRHERISINSFGIGGSNAHVIIDSARSISEPQKPRNGLDAAATAAEKSPGDVPHLLVVSAQSASSLTKMTHDLQGILDTKCNGPKAGNYTQDLAYTLANRREHLPHRAFAIINGSQSGTISPGKRIATPEPNLVMVFTGQGAQWPRMGRDLLLRSDLCFQSTIRSLDKHLRDAQAPIDPQWTLEQELLKPARLSRVHTAEISQPLCTAVQIALVDLFEAVGVKPHAVLGHSSGEIAAAYAVGALTAKEAIISAWQRGQAAKMQTNSGAMAAIGLGWDEVRDLLSPKVVVACENSNKSVTLSGDASAVQETVSRIKKEHPEALARMLKVDKAYHSHHMKDIGDEYRSVIQRHVVGKSPLKPFFSTVTGQLAESPLDASYWQRNLESPVLFRSAVTKLLDQVKNVAFLELGPHSALAGPLRQIFAEVSNSASYASTIQRGEDCAASFLTAIGKLFEMNIPVDFGKLIPVGNCLSGLPTYPWDHETDYWRESRMSNEWRHRKFPSHPLLGVRQLEGTGLEPSWRNLLHIDKGTNTWLRDHKVEDHVVFPCAGYLSMAGEGIRQIGGSQEGFSLRHVVIDAGLVLTEGAPTELVTTFRPHRLTDSLDSQWWEFNISSYNGHMWVKHCTGQVMSESGKPHLAQTQDELPRKLEARRYYDLLDKAGLQFGPQFRRLQDVRCGGVRNLATANVCSDRIGDEEHYHLHPTAVDACIQSALIAGLKGTPNARSYRRVPTRINRLTMHHCVPNVDMNVMSSSEPLIQESSDIVGQVHIIHDGQVFLHIEGLALSPLQEAKEAETENFGSTARLAWGPHIDFLDASSLIKPSLPRHLYTPSLDKLSQLCILYSNRHTKDSQAALPHMQKYQAWIEDQVRNLDAAITTLDDDTILDRIGSLVHRLSDTPVKACADAMEKVVKNIVGLLSGETEALDIFLAGNTLADMYVSMEMCDRSDFIRHLGHTNPNLRVLEIGAGTGASSASILKDLTLSGSTPQALYNKYTFTDISSGFFVSAKELLKDHHNIEYRMLDISKDPAEQGFDATEYDLVIATNVLHATESLGDTLKNVRKLLAPEGRLLLHELFSTSKWPNVVFGTLPGWWNGVSDRRADEPYVSPDRWRSELIDAGFAGLDAIVLDGEEPHQLNAMMVARPQASNDAERKLAVTLLCDDRSGSGNADKISRKLQSRGYAVHRCQLGDKLPSSQDVISTLDFDRGCPFFEDIDQTRYEAFQHLVGQLGDSGMLWVIPPSQIRCVDPRYAQVIGVLRTMRTEMLLDVGTCEVDDISSSIDRVVQVFEKFQLRKGDASLNPEFEYAIVDQTINVPRIYPLLLKNELVSDMQPPEDHMHLDMVTPGRLTSFQWTPIESKPLSGEDVEIQVYAAGLNFRVRCISPIVELNLLTEDGQDVLCALNVVPYPDNGLGIEASGLVSRVGPEVKDLCPGDRVMFLGNDCFSTHAVVRERNCAKIPDTLAFEDAAAMPAVFGTAMYSLIDLGRLKRGQSVLIHSACGGVGLAAIQIAKMIGAEIYATVGNEEKVRYLTDTIGLPRHRIFNSRDTSFADSLMRETRGEGVSLALNSLSGELLHATWRCVAEFGTMVEIGKRDLLGSGQLDMDVFLANRTYACLDLDELKSKRLDICKELLGSIVGAYNGGHITPIRPNKEYDASAIPDAFRYMQQGQHLGKIVVSMRDTNGKIKVGTESCVKIPKKLELDSSASYLLVGGLGGLGRSVARHLVEHNARHLVFLSRSAGQGIDDVEFAHELESMGCKVSFVKGSVTDAGDVTRAVQTAGSALKGILQCSMVLRDEAFLNMSLKEWNEATDPKVRGTWLLHEATLAAGANLDFFVFFSSISGLLGTPGQANYAGANAFLDSFVQYRISLGLAASSIDIGAVMDVGAAALDEGLMQRMKAASALGVMEVELLQYISASITTFSSPRRWDLNTFGSGTAGFIDKNTFVVGLGTTLPLSDPENRAFHRKDRRMAIYHNASSSPSFQSDDGQNGDGLKAFLGRIRAAAAEEGRAQALLETDETADFLAREIGRKLFALLLRQDEDLNIVVPLSQLGMDSLVSVELRAWWRQALGFDITTMELLGMGNLHALGKHAAKVLGKMLG